MISATIEHGIGATVGFIAGLPGESVNSFRGTLHKAFDFLNFPATTVHLFGFYANCGSPNFEKIKSSLVFDPHFVDFPLTDEVHAENCRLLETHFQISSRFWRLDSYENLETDVIRAADEFFPMVNPLRGLMLALYARKVDPLDILSGWTEWLVLHNSRQPDSYARLYQGTLNDFLDFLGTYLRTKGLLDECLIEMIRWERHKHVFRSKAHAQPLIERQAWHDDDTRYSNPSIIIDHFSHAGQFLSESGTSEATAFGFYSRIDGTPAIVRLDDVALLILDLAKEGIDSSELAEELESLGSDGYTTSTPLKSVFSQIFDELQKQDLLICPSANKGDREKRPATHAGVKRGYIPLPN